MAIFFTDKEDFLKQQSCLSMVKQSFEEEIQENNKLKNYFLKALPKPKEKYIKNPDEEQEETQKKYYEDLKNR